MSNRKKVTLAVVGSLLLHLVLALSVVGYYAVFPPPPNPPAKETDDKLPELTLLDTPPGQQQRQYVRTEDDQKTDKKPDDPQFESDKDTAAASEKEGKTPGPLPEQEGKNLEDLMFKNHDFSLDTKGADYNRQSANGGEPAQATPAPTPTASPSPASSPDPKELAMLVSTPTPTPPPNPQQNNAQQQNKQKQGAPQTAYRPQQIVTRMQGNISNRGHSSVGAIGTPQGRFQKAVEDAIGSRWYYYVGQRADLVEIGTVRIEFRIMPSGRVKDARIISNSSNQTFGSVSLQSILDASIPEMPPELATLVPASGLEFTFSFTEM